MKLKTLFVSLAAMSLALVGCKDDSGDKSTPTPPKEKDWTNAQKRGMLETFGFIVPYVKGLKTSYIEFEDGELYLYGTVKSYEKGLAFIDSYDALLAEAEFTGSYREVEEEYEEEVYYSILGDYQHETDKSYTAFDETFEQPLTLTVDCYESYTSWIVVVTAYLETELKQTNDISNVIQNVLGTEIEYESVVGESYSYCYTPDTYNAGVYYADVIVENSSTTESSLLASLTGQHYYIQEGGWLDDFLYWCLPWDEAYEFYLNGIEESNTEGKYNVSLTYGTYTKATIYESFPMDKITEALGFGYDSNYLPSFTSDSEYGFKTWRNSSSYFFVDAIDPKAKNEELSSLSELFIAELNEKNYTLVEGSDDLYEREIDGIGKITVGLREEDFYFTGYYGFTPANTSAE